MSSGLHSVQKAALVLRILATFSPRGAALAEVSEYAGLPKTTTHRVLTALVSERLVERPNGTRLYRLGPELFAFGAGISTMFDFRDVAATSLENLSEQTGELVLLGIRSGYDALCLDRRDGVRTPNDVLIQLLDRWPLGVGVFSLALLAFLPDDEIIEVLAYNARRLRGGSQFYTDHIAEELSKVRTDGYVFLTLPGAPGYEAKAGVAVPIFDRRRRPIASICIIAQERRMRGDSLARYIAMLQREADLISTKHDRRDLTGEDEEESWRAAVKTKINE